jgi:hypothetical protein
VIQSDANGGIADVDQEGYTGNDAEVLQTDFDDTATVDQDGSYNTADINQLDDGAGGSATVRQTGRSNTATVSQ